MRTWGTYTMERENTLWRVTQARICMGQYLDWFIPTSPRRWKRVDVSEGFISSAFCAASRASSRNKEEPTLFVPVALPPSSFSTRISGLLPLVRRDARSRVLRGAHRRDAIRPTTRVYSLYRLVYRQNTLLPTCPRTPDGIYGPVRKVRLHLLRVSLSWLFPRLAREMSQARCRNRDIVRLCVRPTVVVSRQRARDAVVNVYSFRGNLGETS